MKYIFWQNVISIHQSAFIKALAERHDVTLVAEQTLDKQRLNEKWSIPSMGKAKVVLSPQRDEICRLIGINEAHHIFSGINAFPMVYEAFKLAVKHKAEISVFVEPYEWEGIKGFLRLMMYRYLNMRYGRHIKHLFATGDMGVKCYNRAGFPKERIHQWGYFTEVNTPLPQSSSEDRGRKVRLIYVGRLDHNKNILPLLEQFDQFKAHVDCFTIVGDGELLDDVKRIAEKHPEIIIRGRLNNSEAHLLMATHDYLILPSLYDGWGAVVNEALSAGTRVLCSEACGASILLDGRVRGESFKQQNIIKVLKKWISKPHLQNEDREKIKSWVETHITGNIAAKYFETVLDGKSEKAPWLG